MSSRTWVSSRDSSMKRKLATIARIPTGTLMKKIQLQSTCSVMRPPTSGPIASASAETPAQMPIAVPRCCGGKVAAMIESVAGFISAAPTPWSDARGDQLVARVGEAAPERGEGEDAIPSDEDQPPPVRVGHLPADEHERRERQRVAGDDPLELGEVGAEVVLDRGQRDVHDRVVEHDHEEAEGDRGQREPLACLLCEDPSSHAVPFSRG